VAATLTREYEAFVARVDAARNHGLDPYGAEAPEEFFAVASEAFFVSPQAARREHPALYDLLARFYRCDPAG
jgi:Mlc titration factor MtfA (ptsG expression regulator)